MDFKELESFLSGVQSIISCKIIEDQNNNIKEILILSDSSRTSNQIAEDVHATLISYFNIDIDYKLISVAQINKNVSMASRFRLIFDGCTNETNKSNIKIQVRLTCSDREFCGEAEGFKSEENTPKLAAIATINAVKEVLGGMEIFSIETIQFTKILKHNIVLSLIRHLDNNEENLLIGATIITNNKIDSTIKSVLNAINRKVSLYFNQ